MIFYRDPVAFSKLRQFYWQLRSIRAYDQAARRKWYRRIKTERERLASLGFSVEHLRLYCRYLARPFEQNKALHRLQTFEAMLVDFARMQQAAKISLLPVASISTFKDYLLIV